MHQTVSLLRAPSSSARPRARDATPSLAQRIDRLCAAAADAMSKEPKAALALALEGLSLIAEGPATEREAELHGLAGRALIVTDASDRAVGHLVSGADLARLRGQPEIECDCLRSLGVALLVNDDLDGAVREFESALQIAQRLNDPIRSRRIQDNLIVVRRHLGASHEEQLKQWAECAESPHHTAESLISALNNVGRCYVDVGRAEEAIGPLTRAAEVADSPEVSTAAMFVVRANLAVALAACGRGAEALEVLHAAQARARAGGFDREVRQLLAREGEVLRELGRYPESVACLKQARKAAERAGQVGELREACHDLMLSLKALGDFEAALEASESLRRIDQQLNRDRADRRMSALAARFELDKARREAELQAVHNAELKAANVQLRTANGSLRKALQALGFDARRPRPPGTPGDSALTTRERQVLALLGKGRSNRAIGEALGLSSITVRHHVSAILGKLGAASRTEAVALALRNGTL